MAEAIPESGESGVVICPQCGAVSPVGQRFCGQCGAKIATPETPTLAPVASPAPVEPSPAASDVAEAQAASEAEAATVIPSLVSAALPGGTRERERDRLLTLANVQRMRGQFAEAGKTLETVLALSEGRSPREMAPVHEMRGDLLATAGRWVEAQAAYETAHGLDTEKVSAEKKFAEATLRVAEMRAIESGSMLGLSGDSFGDGAFGGGARGKRNPGLAMLLSLFVPGFGQLFNGELMKGGICLAVFLLTLLAVRLSSDSDVLFAKMAGIFAPGSTAAARGTLPLSPLLVALLVLAGLVWLYSLVDAAMGASRSEDNTRGVAPPTGDRSGWEP